MPTLLEEIRRQIASNQFEFSKHAVDQSILRGIQVQELKEAIATGQLIEDYPDDKYGPSCLISGSTQAYRPIHVQCSYPSRPLIKIITTMNLTSSDGAMALQQGAAVMNDWHQTLVEQKVTYTLEMSGKFFLVENVPARVNSETGEQFFSPSTVERLQQIILNQEEPVHFIETPVYNFAG